jgi:hypothetical protein
MQARFNTASAKTKVFHAANHAIKLVGRDIRNTPSYFRHQINYVEGNVSFSHLRWTGKSFGTNVSPLVRPATPAVIMTAVIGTTIGFSVKSALGDFKDAKALTEQGASPLAIHSEQSAGAFSLEFAGFLLIPLAFAAASIVKRVRGYIKDKGAPER